MRTNLLSPVLYVTHTLFLSLLNHCSLTHPCFDMRYLPRSIRWSVFLQQQVGDLDLPVLCSHVQRSEALLYRHTREKNIKPDLLQNLIWLWLLKTLQLIVTVLSWAIFCTWLLRKNHMCLITYNWAICWVMSWQHERLIIWCLKMMKQYKDSGRGDVCCVCVTSDSSAMRQHRSVTVVLNQLGPDRRRVLCVCLHVCIFYVRVCTNTEVTNSYGTWQNPDQIPGWNPLNFDNVNPCLCMSW